MFSSLGRLTRATAPAATRALHRSALPRSCPARSFSLPTQRLLHTSSIPKEASTTTKTESTGKDGPEGKAPKGWRPHPVAVVAVILLVTGGYRMANLNWKGATERRQRTEVEQVKEKKRTGPAFEKRDVMVVFVLGGPGSGKGTNCEKLVNDFGFEHLSAGDLLREEQQRPDSEYGELIKNCIREGLIVPKEVTIALLENAMRRSNKGWFLIDGFPRAMDQALKFEETVVEGSAVLYFECPENVMLQRLLKRGETSGRTDDNIESIKKRFRTFTDTSFPVIEYYEKQGKVIKVSCQDAPENVYAHTKTAIQALIKK